jgi:hypothetical protein
VIALYFKDPAVAGVCATVNRVIDLSHFGHLVIVRPPRGKLGCCNSNLSRGWADTFYLPSFLGSFLGAFLCGSGGVLSILRSTSSGFGGFCFLSVLLMGDLHG